MRLDRPLVPATGEGALRLGELYLDHLRQATATLVRPRRRAGRISLQLAGRVDLISFGDVSASVDRGGVECRFTIAGGVLVARGGGSLTVVQRGGLRPALGLVMEGYAPRLASGRPWLRRLLYENVQARLHTAISNRFLRRMRESAR